jgi:hypothetical protein
VVQMTPDGDYGYDMAHQDVAREAPGRAARPHEEAPPERPRAGAPEEDHGYDEAHDF